MINDCFAIQQNIFKTGRSNLKRKLFTGILEKWCFPLNNIVVNLRVTVFCKTYGDNHQRLFTIIVVQKKKKLQRNMLKTTTLYLFVLSLVKVLMLLYLLDAYRMLISF